MPLIQPITLPVSGIQLLQAEAHREGYDFIDTLVQEWATGENRFDGPGELLVGQFHQGLVIAVGALSRDPFLPEDHIGRIRRIYVRPEWRNQGIGRAIVIDLIDRARPSFPVVRLRAENARAARLYESVGFQPISDPNASHLLRFDTKPENA
jgi:GNAT superfamily N-acetyltransferase